MADINSIPSREEVRAYVLEQPGGREDLVDAVYRYVTEGFTPALAYLIVNPPPDQPSPIAIDRLFSLPDPGDQPEPDDPELHARVYRFVMAQPDGTEELVDEVYRLALCGISIETAYIGVTTTPAPPPDASFDDSDLGGAFAGLGSFFTDAEQGDRIPLSGVHPFSRLDLSGLGLDLNQVFQLGEGGKLEIDVGALIDSVSADTGLNLNANTRALVEQMVAEEFRDFTAGGRVGLKISSPPLSPKQRLQAIVAGWVVKGVMGAEDLKRRIIHMKSNPRTVEGIVRGLELGLMISSAVCFVQSLRTRNTPAGSRALQWSTILLSASAIVGGVGKLTGILPLEHDTEFAPDQGDL